MMIIALMLSRAWILQACMHVCFHTHTHTQYSFRHNNSPLQPAARATQNAISWMPFIQPAGDTPHYALSLKEMAAHYYNLQAKHFKMLPCCKTPSYVPSENRLTAQTCGSCTS